MGLTSNLRDKFNTLLAHHSITTSDIVNFLREYQSPDVNYTISIADTTSEYDIVAYIKGNSLCYYTEATRVVANTSLSCVFKDFNNLKDITGLLNWDTRNTQDFSSLFSGCSALEDLTPLTDWKFDVATDFTDFFKGCTKLADITPLKKWTPKFVTTTNGMFCNCSSLADLSPICAWEFQNLANTTSMFNATAITNLYYIKDWNVSKVTNMSYMFANCTELCNIDEIRSWTINDGITTIASMFEGCSTLTNMIDLDDWNLYRDGNYTNNKNGDHIDITNIVYEAEVVYKYYPIWLPYVLVTKLDSGTNINKKFKLLAYGTVREVEDDDFNIYSIKRGTFTSSITTYQQISIDGSVTLYAWYNNNTIYIGGSNGEEPDTYRIVSNLDMSYMFANMKALYKLDGLADLDSRRCTNMSFLFYNNMSPIDLTGLSNWNVRNITTLQSAFENTKGLLSATALNTWYLRKNKRIVYNSNDAAVNIKDLFEESNIEENYTKYPRWCPVYIDVFLLPGETVRNMFITMAGGNKSNIISVKASFVQPAGELGKDYWKISTDESTLPIYASYVAGTIYVFSDGNICGTDLSHLFDSFENATDLSWIDYIDTKFTTTMAYTFYRCALVTNFSYLEDWDVSNVTDMSYMFANSGAASNTLMSTDDWDVSSVTTMKNMFEHDYVITHLNFMENWDTSAVTTVESMFEGCTALTDISGIANHEFVTSACTNTSHMFDGCSNLTINQYANAVVTSLGDWDVSNVTDMSYMFANNLKFYSVDLYGWDTSNLTNVEGMVAATNVWGGAFLSDLDFGNVTNFKKMFYACPNLLFWRDVLEDLSTWDVSSGIYFDSMFESSGQLRNIAPIQFWHMDSAISVINMFKGTYVSTAVPLDNWNFTKVSGAVVNSKGEAVNITDMFAGTYIAREAEYGLYPKWHPQAAYYNIVSGQLLNKKLKDLVRNATDSTIETIENTLTVLDFTGEYITSFDRRIDISDHTEGGEFYAYLNANYRTGDPVRICISTRSCRAFLPEDLSYAFSGFSALTEIKGFEYVNSANVTNTSYLFWKDSALTDPIIGGLGVSNVTTAEGMFGYTAINDSTVISALSFSDKLVNISKLFAGDTTITDASIIQNWNNESITDISAMFYGCSALADATQLNSWTFTNVSGSVYNSKAGLVNISGAFDDTLVELDITKYPSWYPASAYIPKPTVLTPTLEYNGNTQLNGYYKPGRVDFVQPYTADRGLLPGTYVAKYVPKTGYMWEGGTTEEITVTLVITNASVGADPTDTVIITYDGNEHTNGYDTIPEHVTMVSGSVDRGTNVGTYTATYTLDQYYCWSNGSTVDAVRTLMISSIIVGIKPSNPAPKTFNWEWQTNGCDDLSSETITILGDTQGYNIGTYVSTYEPKPNYCWSDGTRDLVEITLTINRAYCGAKPDYTQTENYVEGHIYSNGYDCPDGVEKDGYDQGEDAGEYTCRYTPDNNHMWIDNTRDTGTVILKIVGINIGPKPIDYATDWTGEVITNGYSADLTKLTVTGIESATNAGEYIATYTPKTNYRWEDYTTNAVSVKLTINRAAIEEDPPSVVNKIYNEEIQGNDYTPGDYISYFRGETQGKYPGTYRAYYVVDSNHKWVNSAIDPDEEWELSLVISYIADAIIPTDKEVTYDGNQHSNGYNATESGAVYDSGDIYGTNVGVYIANYIPFAYHAWTDGTTDSKPCALTINPMPIVGPTGDPDPVTYDGNEHTNGYELPEEGVQLSGYSKATDAGEYTADYTLRGINYIWSDGTTQDKEVKLIIERASTEYVKPIHGTTVTYSYDGQEHTNGCPDYPSTYVTIEGTTKATNAGVYTAKYSINKNYKWSDGSTDTNIIVTLEIGKISVGNKPNESYTDDIHNIEYMEDHYRTPSHVTRVPSVEEESYPTIGVYTFTYTLDEGYKWSDNTDDPVVVSHYITKTSVYKPAQQENPKKCVSSGVVSNGYILPDVGVNMTGQDHGTVVGTYTAYYSLQENYMWRDGTEEDVTIVLILEYDTTPVKPDVSEYTRNETYTGENIYLGYAPPDGIYLVSGAEYGKDVGAYTAKYKPMPGRFKWSDDTEDVVEMTLTIVRASVGAKPTDPPDVQYDGNRHYNGYTENLPDGVEETGSPSGITAGDYVAKYTPDNNHCWSDGTRDEVTVTLTITPASDLVKPTNRNPSATYDGNIHTNGYTRPDPEACSAVGSDSGTDVGTYKITYTPIGNHAWEDGTQTPVEVTLTITPAKAGAKPTNKSTEYTGSDIDNGYVPTPTGITMREDSVNHGTEIGTYTSWYTPDSNHCWNDETTDEVEVVLTITKRSCGAKPVNPATKYYNGNEQTNDYNKPSTVEFATVEGVLYDADRGTDPGTYIAKYKPIDTYCWSDGTEDIVTVTLVIDLTSVGDKPDYTEITANYDGNIHYNGFTKPSHVSFATVEGVLYDSDHGTAIGDYVAKYVPDFGYCWSDEAQDICTITLHIRNAHVGPKPTSPDPKYYTGETLYNDYHPKPDHVSFVTEEGVLYDADNGINVGTYVAKYQPDTDYTWDDNTRDVVTVTLEIVRANVGDKPADVTVYWDGNEHDNNYNTEEKRPTGVDYLRGPQVGTEIGSYVAYYQPDSNHKWSDNSTDEYGLTLRIRCIPVGEKPTSPDPITWDGQEHTNGYTKPDHVTMTEASITKATNVGSYLATYTPDEHYCWNGDTDDRTSVTITLTIVRASVGAKPTSPDPVTYDGQEHNNGYVPTPTYVDMESGGSNTGTLPGNYVAKYTPDSNHKWSDDSTDQVTVTLVINPLGEITKPSAWTTAYNGSVQGPTLPSHTEYVSGDQTATNAGSYNVIIKPEAGYWWTDQTTSNYGWDWSITKLSLGSNQPADGTYSVEYDGNEHKPSDSSTYAFTTNVVWNPAKSSSETNIPEAKSAMGTYTYTLTPNANYKWADQEESATGVVNVTMTISLIVATEISAALMDESINKNTPSEYTPSGKAGIIYKTFNSTDYSESNPQTNGIARSLPHVTYNRLLSTGTAPGSNGQNTAYHNCYNLRTVEYFVLDSGYCWSDAVINKFELESPTQNITIELFIKPYITDIPCPGQAGTGGTHIALAEYTYSAGVSHTDNYYIWLTNTCTSSYKSHIRYVGADDEFSTYAYSGWGDSSYAPPYGETSMRYMLAYYMDHNYAFSDGWSNSQWNWYSSTNTWSPSITLSDEDYIAYMAIYPADSWCPCCQADMGSTSTTPSLSYRNYMDSYVGAWPWGWYVNCITSGCALYDYGNYGIKCSNCYNTSNMWISVHDDVYCFNCHGNYPIAWNEGGYGYLGTTICPTCNSTSGLSGSSSSWSNYWSCSNPGCGELTASNIPYCPGCSSTEWEFTNSSMDSELAMAHCTNCGQWRYNIELSSSPSPGSGPTCPNCGGNLDDMGSGSWYCTSCMTTWMAYHSDCGGSNTTYDSYMYQWYCYDCSTFFGEPDWRQM